MNNNIKVYEKSKENWIGELCSEIEENLRKNNGKRAYELVKDLTTVKQGKATTVQDHSEKCLVEEREILNGWTEYCTKLYNHKANGDPSVLDSPQTDTDGDQPIFHKEGSSGHPLCVSGDSSVLMDLCWPCDCTAQSSILSINSEQYSVHRLSEKNQQARTH